MKNKKLGDDIEENRDRDHIANGNERTAQQFTPPCSVKSERPEKRRNSSPVISNSTPHTQQDRHCWLHHEAQSARSRQTSQDVLKKLIREQVRITGLY